MLTALLHAIAGSALASDGARPFVLATVSSSVNDYLDTLNTMRMVTQAKEIRTKSMKQENVSLSNLSLEPLRQDFLC